MKIEVQIRQGNNTIFHAGKIDLDNIAITGNTIEATKSILIQQYRHY